MLDCLYLNSMCELFERNNSYTNHRKDLEFELIKIGEFVFQSVNCKLKVDALYITVHK